MAIAHLIVEEDIARSFPRVTAAERRQIESRYVVARVEREAADPRESLVASTMSPAGCLAESTTCAEEEWRKRRGSSVNGRA
jgi:hypothetical protein